VKKLPAILFLLVLLPVSLHAQGTAFPSRGGGAVQGVLQQGQNAFPLNPVISGALAPSVNANLQGVGLDNFVTSNVIVSNGFNGNVVLLPSLPVPTKSGEWALVAVAGGTDFNSSVLSGIGSSNPGPWTCLDFPGCGTGAAGLHLLTLSNASPGNLVSRTYINANTNQSNPLIATLWSGTPSIRTHSGASGSNPFTFPATVAGSTLVLGVECAGTVSPCVSGLTDGQGNKWKQLAIVNGNPANTSIGISLWVSSTPSSSGAEVVTATLFPGVTQNPGFAFLELTGLSASLPNQPAVGVAADALGNLIVRQDAHGANLFNCSVTLTTNTTATCQAIPVSVNGVAVRAYVTDFQLNTTTAGVGTAITLQYGTGGNCAGGTNLSAIAYPNTSTGIASVLGVRTPLIPALSAAICATQAGTTAGTTVVEIRGFIAP
jgi:hypothetical protein